MSVMKNIAVFCRDRKQFHNYLTETTGRFPLFEQSCHTFTMVGDIKYYYMNGVSKADYVRGIRWQGIIHLPEYNKRQELLEEVMFNLREAPKKSKRETLIEELESKLAELKQEVN